MKPNHRSRFDSGALRALAGDKVFGRGEVYHRGGQVELVAVETGRVVARVAGTEDYRTVLTGHGAEIGGECSCPAAEDWGFCKHMVATALAVNAAGPEVVAEAAGAITRIRDHLKSKGLDALIDMIVGLAERDHALFDKLELAAAAVQADDKTLTTRLRKAIDRATSTPGYIDYREAGSWAAGVEEALDKLGELAESERAALALPLAEHAISQIEEAVEELDDSDGHCGALLERAQEIHLAACRAARPDPIELARDLFDRETDGDFEAFSGAAAIYAEVLGEPGLAEYRRLAEEAWTKVPARVGGRDARNDFSSHQFQLESILDFFAERDGDVEARIALRAKDLSSPWRYLQLAEFCLAQGRDDEALRRAGEGLWMFEDARPDQRLVLFAADRLAKASRKDEALAHVNRAYEKAPSLELYVRLRELGGEAARERALAFFEARLAKEKPTNWKWPADLLVRILIHENMFDAAWSAVHRHGASGTVKDSLARASEATHPREALKVYAEHVEKLAQAGGNAAYEKAATLIARMAALRGEGDQAAYIAALKERHGRKRNFMKLLV